MKNPMNRLVALPCIRTQCRGPCGPRGNPGDLADLQPGRKLYIVRQHRRRRWRLCNRRRAQNVPDPGGNDDTLNTAFLFRYANGAWTYVRPLMSDLDHNEGDGANSQGIDMRDGIAALALQPIRVFERLGADYVERTITGPGTTL